MLVSTEAHLVINGEEKAVAIARRNPHDAWDRAAGRKLAITRVLEAIDDKATRTKIWEALACQAKPKPQ